LLPYPEIAARFRNGRILLGSRKWQVFCGNTLLPFLHLHILPPVDALFAHIDQRLRTHKYCVVFENTLQRVWPVAQKERLKRAAAIEAFARAHGLTAVIHDPGIRVTFRRAGPEPDQERNPRPPGQLAPARSR
jgi:hypothetical protein